MGIRQTYTEHYKKVYPGCRVHHTDHSFDVFSSDGKHQVALRKDGHGMWVCKSEEHGCEAVHNLSPGDKPTPVASKGNSGTRVRDV